MDRLNILKEKGYKEDLNIKNGKLVTTAGTSLPKSNICIDEIFRIEDDSDPTHQTIIYALSCNQPQTKGVLINSFGTYSDPEKDKLIKQISAQS